MQAETRNTKVAAALIAAMTCGAIILLWLEPNVVSATRRSGGVSALALAGSTPISDILVEYGRMGDVEAGGRCCLILPDGACDAQPAGGNALRLIVVGSDTPQQTTLTDAQKRSLLALLGSINYGNGGVRTTVALDETSDARLSPDLPPQARDLCNLLVRKGFIQ